MIRLEKREDKSSPHHHEFDIYYSTDGEEWKKTGRAFLHREGDEERWILAMMERQKIRKNRYGEYPALSQEAITALVEQAKELGISHLFLSQRKGDPEEFHDHLNDLGFVHNGLVFEMDVEPEKAREPLKNLAKRLGSHWLRRVKK